MAKIEVKCPYCGKVSALTVSIHRIILIFHENDLTDADTEGIRFKLDFLNILGDFEKCSFFSGDNIIFLLLRG